MRTRFCYCLGSENKRFPGLLGKCLSVIFLCLTPGPRANLFSVVKTRLQNCNPISNRVCLDNDIRVLTAACKHKVPANGANLEETIENHNGTGATYKSSDYTSHGMLKFSNCCGK